MYIQMLLGHKRKQAKEEVKALHTETVRMNEEHGGEHGACRTGGIFCHLNELDF